MDDSLLEFSECRRFRSVFGRPLNAKPANTEAPEPADPLYPSLDVELPEVRKSQQGDQPELHRYPWDPRDRWRRLEPSQPLHAPPYGDLPAQFRYEDLSILEKSETMGVEQDRLLAWLMRKFEQSLEFKYTGQLSGLTADQAVRQQEFTPLQALDEELENLGLSSVDPALVQRRKKLTEAATAESTKSGYEEEDEEFSDFVSPQVQQQVQVQVQQHQQQQQQQQQQQVVLTVHEAAPKAPRSKRQMAAGDVTSAGSNSIECLVDVRGSRRVAQFGDAATSCSSTTITDPLRSNADEAV